jgi:hypothetical protein
MCELYQTTSSPSETASQEMFKAFFLNLLHEEIIDLFCRPELTRDDRFLLYGSLWLRFQYDR